MERDLTFQGLIIFRNELRDDSAATIAKLKVSAEIWFSVCFPALFLRIFT